MEENDKLADALFKMVDLIQKIDNRVCALQAQQRAVSELFFKYIGKNNKALIERLKTDYLDYVASALAETLNDRDVLVKEFHDLFEIFSHRPS